MEESEAVQKIYDLVLNSDSMQFVFNKRIIDELGSNFAEDFQERVFPFAKKIPIPLTRHDGAYKMDGSLLYGGNFGGALRYLLPPDHPTNLENAARYLAPSDYLYYTKPRKKEFDIEHMESAFECGAELFITTDKKALNLLGQKALNLLGQAVKSYPAEHPIVYMHSIAKLPSIALKLLMSGNQHDR